MIFPGLDARTLLGLVVFLAVIALAISRPRGLNEAWPAAGGAAAFLALGLLSPRDLLGAARETSGVLLFLFGMMVLSGVLEMAGIFSWAASYAARTSGGSGRPPLIKVFLLGAGVTPLLSLDFTVIVLPPSLYSPVLGLRGVTRPSLF